VAVSRALEAAGWLGKGTEGSWTKWNLYLQPQTL